MSDYLSINRRMFLRGLGATALAIPWLSSISKPAGAAGQKPPKRFIALKSYNGQLAEQFYPVHRGDGFVLHSKAHENEGGWSGGQKVKDVTTYLGPHVMGRDYASASLVELAQKSGQISAVLGPWLNAKAGKLNLVRGLDSLADVNHNNGLMLGHASSCLSEHGQKLAPWPTIDQVLAYSSKFYAKAPSLRSLHLNPVNDSGTFWVGGSPAPNSMSFTQFGKANGPVQPVNAIQNPKTAFDLMFGDVSMEDQKRKGTDLKLVDAVFEDYRRVSKNSRLGASDKQRLEQHMTHLSELQERFKADRTQCMPGESPASQMDAEDLSPGTIAQVYDDLVNLMVAAIQCDITRVVTLDMVKVVVEGSTMTYGARQVGVNPGSWHNDAHSVVDGQARARILAMNQWLSQNVFAKLLDRLDQEEVDGTTYLDNSLVYWGNEMSGGYLHFCYSMPCVLAGSAGGAIRTGQYLDYIDWDHYASFFFEPEKYVLIRGVPHNRLFVSIMQSMGLAPEDYERAGQKGFGNFERNGIDFETHKLVYDSAKHGQVLHGLMT